MSQDLDFDEETGEYIYDKSFQIEKEEQPENLPFSYVSSDSEVEDDVGTMSFTKSKHQVV